MSFVDKFKEYSFKKQGFIVEIATRKVVGSKSVKVVVLKKILPQAIVNGVLNLPEVDEIKFNAIANLSNQTINVINIPASVKVIEKQGYIYPFAKLNSLYKITTENTKPENFFMVNQDLYYSSSIPQNKNSRALKTQLQPKAIELVNTFSSKYFVPQTPPFVTTKTIIINNGAFAFVNSQSQINTELNNGQSLQLNPAKDEHLKHNYPDEIIINGKTLTQSEFLFNGGRMLVEIKNNNNNLSVSHIDCTDYVEKFANFDLVEEPLSTWKNKTMGKWLWNVKLKNKKAPNFWCFF